MRNLLLTTSLIYSFLWISCSKETNSSELLAESGITLEELKDQVIGVKKGINAELSDVDAKIKTIDGDLVYLDGEMKKNKLAQKKSLSAIRQELLDMQQRYQVELENVYKDVEREFIKNNRRTNERINGLVTVLVERIKINNEGIRRNSEAIQLLEKRVVKLENRVTNLETHQGIGSTPTPQQPTFSQNQYICRFKRTVRDYKWSSHDVLEDSSLIKGPESVKLPDAVEKSCSACGPFEQWSFKGSNPSVTRNCQEYGTLENHLQMNNLYKYVLTYCDQYYMTQCQLDTCYDSTTGQIVEKNKIEHLIPGKCKVDFPNLQRK